jgi:hypothetical protein
VKITATAGAKPQAGSQAAKPAQTAAAAPAAMQVPAAAAAATVPKAPASPMGGMKAPNVPASSVLDDCEEIFSAGNISMRQLLPAISISLVAHMLLLIILGLITGQPQVKDTPRELVAQVAEERGETLDVVEETPVPLDVDITDFSIDSSVSDFVDVPTTAEPVAEVTVDNIGIEQIAVSDLSAKIGQAGAASISDSRSEKGRMATVAARGGNSASEAAVAKALEWLSHHQLPDGGWSMDHTAAPSCKGKCKDPGGHVEARMGATALGLLPFLGAGQTHKQGKYKKEVQAGLLFIKNNMKRGPEGGDCRDRRGTLYSHGLCAIALCEAYGMTQDKFLANDAQLALNYISYAQDPTGGGWRYAPKQAGDTSVVGWQLMALKSGHMNHLPISMETIKGATKFLESVKGEGGAYYGYDTPTDKHRPGTTAVGLLCRMYLGWKHEEPALEKGVQYLAKTGPSKTDIYYNYYATQVLHHYEGELWTKWNDKMRDQLVETQAKQGHEAGSWFSGSGHANEAGGRLYMTSLSCMTLEVYYRHLPLYKKSSTEDDF